jgi:two-component system sensor histidine kinase KdpD
MRYVFAVTSILIVTAVALVLQSYDLRDAELPALVLAIGIVTWYAGSGPAAVAVVLAAATFNYLFVEPIYTFYVSGQDLPYFVIFVLSAVTVTFFSSVRRRSEESLRQARDRLQIELDQRQRREGEIRRLNQELTLRASELAAANKELESCSFYV